MSQVQFVDELIREYLLFRGFSATLKTFDSELKSDKDKGFRVDKIVDQLLQYINSCDLNSLRELWSHLDQKMFSRLEHHFTNAVRKLENAILKLYLVNAVMTNKPEKIMDFFNKMTPDLISQPEWKEWFMLPFVRYPEENPVFAVHFTRQWQDTLLVSLHNFIATVFQCMPLPALCACEEEAARVRRLQDENESLRQRLAASAALVDGSGRPAGGSAVPDLPGSAGLEPAPAPPASDLMDDFYVIAQEALCLNADSQSKTLKSLIRNIGSGLPSSPVLPRRPASGKKLSTSSSADESPQPQPPQRSRAAHRPRPAAPAGPAAPVRRADSRTRPEPSGADGSERRATSAGRRLGPGSPSFILLSQEEFGEHHTAVTQCRFNSSGALVASADCSGVVKLWSMAPSPKTLATFVSKTAVLSLGWVSKNERYFLTGHRGGLVKLYDSRDYKVIWELLAETSCALDVSTQQLTERALTALRRVQEVVSSPCESSFVCSVSCAGLSPEPGRLLLYDLKTRQLEQSVALGGGATAGCCAFNHNGQLLFAGCSDGTVRAFDLRCHSCIDSWPLHTGPVEALHLSADFTACFTLACDGKVRQSSLSQSGQLLWEAALPPGCSPPPPPHGQLCAPDPSGCFLLLCASAGAAIAHVEPDGLSLQLEMGGLPGPALATDWAIARQCAVCVAAAADGRICLSTLLTP